MVLGHVDWGCFVVGAVGREGCFQGGEGTRVEAVVGEDLAEFRWSVEVDSGGFFLESVCSGVLREDLKIFCKDAFEFR